MKTEVFLTTCKALSKAMHTMQGVNQTISQRDSLEWIDRAIKVLGFNDLDDLDRYLTKNKERIYDIRKTY